MASALDIEGASKTDLHMIPPESLIIVGLDTEDGQEHYLYDSRIKLPLNEAMVRNIAFQGVIENVIAVRDGDRILVAAGRQRVRHARAANEQLKKEGSSVLIRCPVVIKRCTEKATIGIMISENALRRDDGIIEKAEKCGRMIGMGHTEDECALAFGVTKSQIKNWQSLLTVSAPVRKAVESGKIAATAAVQLASLSAEKQREKLEEILKDSGDKKVSVTKVNKALGKKRRAKHVEDPRPLAPVQNAVFERLAEMDAKKKLTGAERGFYDCIAWMLGKLTPEETASDYESLAEVLNPAREAVEA